MSPFEIDGLDNFFQVDECYSNHVEAHEYGVWQGPVTPETEAARLRDSRTLG